MDTNDKDDKIVEQKVTKVKVVPQKKQVVVSELPLATQRKRRIIVVVGLIVVAFAIGVGGTLLYQNGRDVAVTQTPRTGTDGNTIVTKQEADIAGVASKVGSSVVSVLTTSQAASYTGSVAEQDGAGTGIIISKDGYILTNKHVIEGATTVLVVTSDGTTYSNVKVVGSDPLNDVAFLKISGVSNLKPAELGDSTSVRIGQSVVAIGNALGQYQNTVTSGIISGTNRSVTASLDGRSTDSETLTDMIQTDAAINSGNSGGPLVNMAGQVIGINTAIVSDANGIGFVLPISSARGILDGVLATGRVSRAYLGVHYLSVTADVAKTYNLPVSSGAYIFDPNGGQAVVSGGPAAAAGIQDKDVITKVNDMPIGTEGSISSLVGEFRPGDTIKLTYIRGGQTKTTTVKLVPYSS